MQTEALQEEITQLLQATWRDQSFRSSSEKVQVRRVHYRPYSYHNFLPSTPLAFHALSLSFPPFFFAPVPCFHAFILSSLLILSPSWQLLNIRSAVEAMAYEDWAVDYNDVSVLCTVVWLPL